MVHRPSDSRLLLNLINHEKDYIKQLHSLLDYSHASLSSFQAYAAASAPPASGVIVSVAGSFSGADEALKRYAGAVDTWREQLKDLKTLEDDVGTIMRDREILVTRLIKASKSTKPNRDSYSAPSGIPSSTSTVSLKSDFSASLTGSSKLSSAQAELQACEAQLAARERELDAKRASAIRDGIGARAKAMVECGWAWGEMGKESLSALRVLGGEQHDTGIPSASPSRAQSPSQFHKPLPDPLPRPSVSSALSDVSSIAPSQSASNIALPLATFPASAGNGHYHDRAVSTPPPSSQDHDPDSQSQSQSQSHNNSLSHSNNNHEQEMQARSPNLTIRQPTTLVRRITEESMRQMGKSAESEEEGEEGVGSSDEDEAAGSAVVTVENPRFAAGAKRNANANGNGNASGNGNGNGNGFSIRGPPAAASSDIGPRSQEKEKGKERKGSGFFGSIRGLFKSNSKDSQSLRDGEGAPRRESESAQRASIFAAGGGKGSGQWATRTDKNLKAAKRGKAGDSSDEGGGGGGGGARARMARSDVGPSTASPKLKKRNTAKRNADGNGAVKARERDEAVDARELGEQRVSTWMDGSAAPANLNGDGAVTVKRKGTGTSKSASTRKVKKAKPLIPEGGQMYVVPDSVAANTLSNSQTNLSRNNSASRGSFVFAPSGSSRGRRASTQGLGDGSGNSIGAAGAPLPKRAASVHTPEKLRKQGHERRPSGGANNAAPLNATSSNAESLMSIVEGASKARQTSQTIQASQSLPATGAGAGLYQIPKAPARVTRADLDYSLPMIQANAAMGLALPKAPASVFAKDGMNGSAVGASTSTSGSGSGNGNGNGNGHGHANGYGNGYAAAPTIIAPVPFKPDVANIAAPHKRPDSTSSLGVPKPLKSALRPSSRSPSPNPWSPPQSPPARPSRPLSPPVQAPSVLAAPAPAPAVVPSGPNTELLSPGPSRRDSDISSVSSYETGHEVFYDEPEAEEKEKEKYVAPPPPPPPHEPLHANAGGASDVSASTASTQTPGPVRRKSVRVSLEPTFSPTPPAFDDDERHAPWSSTPRVHRRADAGPSSSSRKAADPERDMWEDSSEEDEEYQNARKMLSKVGKKKKSSK